ncbi:hypothetical protein [Paracidovorax citrulli]
MNLLVAFLPFIVFAIVERAAGFAAGLAVGAVIAIVLIVRDLFARRSLKVLEVGTALMFAGLALYAHLAQPAWSIGFVRLLVDGGLLLIALISIAIRMPFTLQYAREQVPREHWQSPAFIRTNYAITLAWAGAFLALVIADLLLAYALVPPALAVAMIVAALWGAVRFTRMRSGQARAAQEGP